jgi:hypothetical protein
MNSSVKFAPMVAVLGSTMLLAACVSSGVRDAPCYDGWTGDQSGRSVLWSPPSADLREIEELIPQDQELQCIHRMPSGRLVVLSKSDEGVHSLELLTSSDEYQIIERGWVVGHE